MRRSPEELASQEARSRVAARPIAMQCVDTAFTGSGQAAVDVRQITSGLASATMNRTEAPVSSRAT